MQLIGNDQLKLEEETKAKVDREMKGKDSTPSEAMVSQLSAHVRTAFEKAKQEKIKFHAQMIANLLQIKGEYDPQKLADIKQLGSDLFMMITDVKSRTAKAMLKEVYFQSGEKPFSIEPTPVPSLSPQNEKLAEITYMAEMQKWMQTAAQSGLDPMAIQQAMMQALPKFKDQYRAIIMDIAKDKAEMMSAKIDDQLVEGGFYESLAACLMDVVDLKAGFIKGPVYRKKKTLNIGEAADGRGKVQVKEEIIPTWDSPSPFDMFPLPGVTSTAKGGLIERLFFRRTDLQDMIGLPGFDEVAIREILRTFTDKGWHEWTWNEQERIEAEGRESSQYYSWDTIECLEYNDSVPGRLILEWAGRNPDDPNGEKLFGKSIDPDFDYDVKCWLISNWILAVRLNDNPLGDKGYYKASYVEEKNSFWGRGLPETIPDAQSLANSAIRALQNNVGISSGPQCAIDTASLAPGQDVTRMWPWKIWKFVKNTFGSTTEPFMQFYQANMHAQELITVYDKASKIADEHCGVAGYAHGDNNITGGGDTAAGLSMLMGQQNRGLRDVAFTIDSGIIIPLVKAQYYENYNLDDALEYIGDVKIQAKGSSWLMLREQMALRLNDFLRNAGTIPVFQELMGREGLKYGLKESAKNMNLDPAKLVPDAPLEQLPVQGAMAPPAGGTNVDAAGNPVQGTAIRMAPTGPSMQQ